jgi:hypothetical protein
MNVPETNIKYTMDTKINMQNMKNRGTILVTQA